jgi:peroxiredoxin-like protein
MTFTTKAQWNAGSRGTVEGEPMAQSIEFSAPPEFHGEGGLWSPEHFLLAAVASCFVTTFKAIAEFSSFQPVALAIGVEGAVEKGAGGYAFTRVTLKPELTVEQESDRERGMRLLEKTERSCLISRSLKVTPKMFAAVTVAPAKLAA